MTKALAGLKDFQRATVDQVFRRLWTDDDPVDRFLVADEVGLGKTMVAKGVIAKAVDHLWDTGKRIDIVYICSNSQIAQQNLSRLNVVGGAEHKHADRLTMLPTAIRDMRERRINFVSFTPGTSFQVGRSGGKSQERVLLYWMLVTCWGSQVHGKTRWVRFFEGGKSRQNFANELGCFDRGGLDPELCRSFGAAIDEAVGPDGGPLRQELEACADRFNYLRGKPMPDLGWRRDQIVGTLRQVLARVAVAHLEPDLVILDEFQRFKDLLDADDESARLARAVFDHRDAKVLLLSATPYKMYTLPDEPDGDDHHQDFTRMVRFLAGAARATVVDRELRTLRENLVSGGDLVRAREARDVVQGELRRVMTRTERLSSTPDRNGMLIELPLAGVSLSAEDLRAWLTYDKVARLIGSQDVFEYWRSAPYPLNLMERDSYQVRKKFQAAAERDDPLVAAALRASRGLLDWDDIRRYQAVDPGNAKMRGLSDDVLDRGAWRLAWLPPSLPYYELGNAYAEPALRSFTKRLVFSAWTVVPKAIAVMLSYEAERRAVQAAGPGGRAYDDRPIAPPLQFRTNGDRPAGMPTLALVYPCSVLARAGDPLEIARSIGAGLRLDRESLTKTVRGRMTDLLRELPPGSPGNGTPDQRWYWAAPLLLDRRLLPADNATFVVRCDAGLPWMMTASHG